MSSTVNLTIFFALLLMRHANCSITLGTCSLSCNENEHEAIDQLGVDRVMGVPGKSGPVGPKGPPGRRGNQGPPGPPGVSCDCSRYDELQRQLDEIKQNMERMTDRMRLGSLGWLGASNGLYYQYFTDHVDYSTAKSKCEDHGGRLAAAGLRTANLRKEIREFFPKPIRTTWIGLDDLAQQGVYVWSDGVTSTRSNTDWHPSEPTHATERCAAMYSAFNGQIVDIDCAAKLDFICEVSP